MKATEFKVMLKAINLRIKPLTALSMFFSKEKTHPTGTIQFDVKTGKRIMAPFVSPYIGGKAVEKMGFSTKELELPKISPERLTHIMDLEQVGFGQNEYQVKTVAQRQKEQVAEDLVELDEQISRTEEWMRREVLLTKGVLIEGEGIKKFIKFADDDKVVLSGNDIWSDQANSDPLAILDQYHESIIKATGKAPKICLMDSKSATAFMSHPKVVKAFDTRHIILGQLEPRVKTDGTTFIGKYSKLDMDIITYAEWFIDKDGHEKPMLPEGTVVLGSKDIGKMHYAAVKMFKNGKPVSIEAKRAPKHIVDEDTETEKMRLTSRPLPVPFDTKAWQVLDVL